MIQEKEKNNQDFDKKEIFIPINSLDNQLFVERMPTRKSVSKDIYLYGIDNIYPQKVEEIAKRSNSMQTAIGTKARFLRGQGFENDTQILNSKNQTGFDILRYIAREKSLISFALHLSFNVFGEITEITPVDFASVRENLPSGKQRKFTISKDWTKREFSFLQEKEYSLNEFNPYTVLEEIEEAGGLDKYKGQLYYSNPQKTVYPLAYFDSVLDDAQSEAESKLYKLSNIQNGFSASGILKLPFNINTKEQKTTILDKLKRSAKGSTNAGRIIEVTVPNIPGEVSSVFNKMFEEISLPDVDSMFKNLSEESKRNIYELYQQPSILNGRSDSGMFNQQSMQDAYDFYNSVTEIERTDIENVLTLLIENSIYSNFVKWPVKIKPQTFIKTA